jgi:hypothetical protein
MGMAIIVVLVIKVIFLLIALVAAIFLPRGVKQRAFVREGDACFEIPPRSATARERWIARWIAWPIAIGAAANLFLTVPIYLWLPVAWAIGIVPTAIASMVHERYLRTSAVRLAWKIRRHYSKRSTGN